MRRPALRLDPSVQVILVGGIGSLLITVVALLLAFNAARTSRANETHDLQAQADAAAHEAARFLRERIDTLRAIARAPGLHDGQPETDPQLLESLRGVSGFVVVSLVDAQGRVRASSEPLPTSGVWVGDRDFVQDILRTHQPSVGSAVIGRLVPEPLVPIGVPFEWSPGQFDGVLTGGFPLANTKGLRFSVSGDLQIIGRSGTLLFDATRQRTPLEDMHSWTNFTRVTEGGRGTFRGEGLHAGDDDSVTAYARVPEQDWVIVLSRPAAALYADEIGRAHV